MRTSTYPLPDERGMRGRRSTTKKEIGRSPGSLWKRAAAAVKDKSSLYVAMVANRQGFRIPNLEASIIKATSHDESTIDYKNAQRVFSWVRSSPSCVKPLLWALSKRMQKTHSWVVALKGLMLTHGLLSIKTPAISKLGRLPYDLSRFNDRYANPVQTVAISAFARAYFSFLDERSNFSDTSDDPLVEYNSMMGTLVELQRSQALLDLLLQIRPCANGLNLGLVLEAMDCVVIEICEVYSGICNGIARVLACIYMAGSSEAAIALQVLQKASSQSAQLSSFFSVCRCLGVWNSSKFPHVEQIPEDDIRDLQMLISRVPRSEKLDFQALEESIEKPRDSPGTVVTLNWVLFQDEGREADGLSKDIDTTNPFVDFAGYEMDEWEDFSSWHQEQYRSLQKWRADLDKNQRRLAYYL